MLSTLPNELLVEIVSHLAHDVKALQSCALVCRSLLPVVREELFVVLNILALEREHMRPYFFLTRQLRVGPGYEADILASEAFSSLNPQTLPNLTGFSFVGQNFVTHTRLHRPMYDALGTFTAVAELALVNVVFLHLKHLQSLVCSLPNLTSLSLHRVTYEFLWGATGRVRLLKDIDDLLTLRPRLHQLSIYPVPFSSYVPDQVFSDVVGWLAQGPTQDTLVKLTIPDGASCPEGIIRKFGPSVEHLIMPTHEMAACILSDDLHSYTSLRSLTVSLEISIPTRSRWDLLAHLFQHSIVAPRLHTITLHLRLDHPLPSSLRRAIHWDTLDHLQTELTGSKFGALHTLEVVVLWAESWGRNIEAETESLLRKIRRRLARFCTQKILVTTHRMLQETGGIEC